MADPATLPLLLKALRLPTIAQCWKTLNEEAQEQGWSPARYLTHLCEQELAEREARRIYRYTKQSQLPAGKTLASFDFTHAKGVERRRIDALAQDSEWVRQGHNLIVFGPSGVGKTHLCAAISHAMLEQGLRVRYFTATELVQSLQRARQDFALPEALSKLDRFDIILIDDLGYVKKTEQETSVLFELIAHRYESQSLMITSNQPFSDWDQVFADTMMTVAAVDRLIHHATIFELKAQSYRKHQAINQQTSKGKATMTNDN